jgi:hypothetical protein
MRDVFIDTLIEAVQEHYKTAPRRATAHKRWSAYPPAKQLRGVPVVGRGVGSTKPGSDPAADADLSPLTQKARVREEIVKELQRRAGYDENGDPRPRKRSKREVASIIRTIFQNMDAAPNWEIYNNLRDTYMLKGRKDLPSDANWLLMSSLRMAWLKAHAEVSMTTPKPLGPRAQKRQKIKSAILEDLHSGQRRSDREIAREIALEFGKCSPTTVGGIRREVEARSSNVEQGEPTMNTTAEPRRTVERVSDLERDVALIKRDLGLVSDKDAEEAVELFIDSAAQDEPSR